MSADGEELREAQERVRQAQEGVRETRERLDTDSRQVQEASRVRAEGERVVAEDKREEAFQLPVWVPQTKKAALIAALVLVFAVSVPMGYISFRVADSRSEGRAEDDRRQAARQVESELRGCEDDKRDRMDNARAWTQAERVWRKNSLDPAVPSKERARAAVTATKYGETANQLRSRLLECRPYVEGGRKVIDQQALLEAQGKL